MAFFSLPFLTEETVTFLLQSWGHSCHLLNCWQLNISSLCSWWLSDLTFCLKGIRQLHAQSCVCNILSYLAPKQLAVSYSVWRLAYWGRESALWLIFIPCFYRKKFPNRNQTSRERNPKEKQQHFEWDLKVCFNKTVLYLSVWFRSCLGGEEIKETHYFPSLSIVLQTLFKVPEKIKTFLGAFYPHFIYIWRFIIFEIPHIYSVAVVNHIFFT